MVGFTVSHYRILQKLGSGGMGDVYLAEDSLLERQVALKALPAEVANDNERICRFIREAKATSALNHPNILTIYEIVEFEGSYFIASEYIKGETLRERQKREPLSLNETLEIVLQVASALAAAHKAGVIHCDIKPENIMLFGDGMVKVVDFGLAELTETKLPDVRKSQAKTLKAHASLGVIGGGTITYMSPEQIKGKVVDARTDVWSLGVCLYELLAGHQPFQEETWGDTIAAILKSEFVPLGENMPGEVRRIVDRALKKNRDERYQIMKDFLLDLKAFKHDLEVTGGIKYSKKRLLTWTELVKAVKHHSRSFMVVFAILLLAAIGFAIRYRHHTARIEAQQHIAAGRDFWGERTGDNLNKAKEQFELAISKAPDEAQGYSDLADTYVLMEEYLGIPTLETLPKAEDYANKALAINDSVAETHNSLAFIQTKLWKWGNAEEEFKRAIELNPKYPKAYQWYSLYLRIVGRPEEALTQIKLASDLDQSSKIIRVNIVLAYIANDDYESAGKEGDALVSLAPTFWGGRSWRGMVYLKQGRIKDAISDLEAGVFHSERSHTLLGNLGYGYAVSGNTKKAIDILKELKELYQRQRATGQDLAKVYTGLGQKETALYWLEKDYEVRSGDLPHISWHPAFERLHDDPRYNDLLQRMGLQPKPVKTDSK